MNRLFFTLLAYLSVSICNAGTFTITPDTIDFGTVTSGSGVQPEVTINNTGNDILIIGNIADTNPVVNPFSIFVGSCANSIIQPGGQCSFMVLFSPESEGDYPDSFNIEVITENLSYEVILQGKGGLAADEPDILVSYSSVDFGVVDVLDSDLSQPYTFRQVIQNDGKLDLHISSIDITGNSADEIITSGNCLDLSPLSTGYNCFFQIEFTPLTTGDKYAEMTIVTNDPDENPFIIPIRGYASGEDDGVPAEVEDAGPNSGDGNFDGILDSKQSNVTTLIDFYGNYVTYVTDSGYRFKNMSTLQHTDIPPEFAIGSGIFDFTVEGLGAGQSIELGVIMPAGIIPTAYYVYGPTAENTADHWFDFNFDGESGAYIFGDVSFTSLSGTKYTRSVLKMIITDGNNGDTDMTVNGSIAMTSAMPVNQSDSSGSINLGYMIFTFFLLVSSRKKYRYLMH